MIFSNHTSYDKTQTGVAVPLKTQISHVYPPDFVPITLSLHVIAALSVFVDTPPAHISPTAALSMFLQPCQRLSPNSCNSVRTPVPLPYSCHCPYCIPVTTVC
jgi:hypothetical protein